MTYMKHLPRQSQEKQLKVKQFTKAKLYPATNDRINAMDKSSRNYRKIIYAYQQV
jgi:hypothetical protein